MTRTSEEQNNIELQIDTHMNPSVKMRIREFKYLRHFHSQEHKLNQISFGYWSSKWLTSPNQDFLFCFTFTFMVAFGCRSVKLDYKALAHQAVVMRTTGFKEKPQLSHSHPSNQPRVCQCEQPIAVPS